MPKTPVYFVPGLAAGKEIFRNIRLPADQYEIHILEWLIPQKGESLLAYAKRMADRVSLPNAVLVGVSFGGVMAQEMSQYLELRELIIVSSVKTRRELPRRLQFARRTRAYKLIPTRLVLSATDLRKFSVGPRSRKRLTLYQEYLSVRNKAYLDWAIRNMVCWQRVEPVEKVIHIHGDADIVFPIQYIKECEIIEGGTHVMILNKASIISERLQKIIENSEAVVSLD